MNTGASICLPRGRRVSINDLIRKAPHQFRNDTVYSFRQIGLLIGVTAQGVRYRALTDDWPLIKVFSLRNKNHKTRLVDGGFLRQIQLRYKRTNAKASA